jgi:hypothetical protein
MLKQWKREVEVKKVVAAARAIVTYEVGIPRGFQRLSRALSWLAPYETALPTICNEYFAAIKGLPIGTERLEWDRQILKEKDVELEAINQKFRDALFETCWALIDRFDSSKN